MEYGEQAAPLEEVSEGGQPEGTPTEQAAPITRQDFEKLTEMVDGLRREFRVVQGSVDSSEARVKKMLAERDVKIEEYAKSRGLEKSDADYLKRQFLLDDARRELSTEPQGPKPKASAPVSTQNQKVIDEVNTWLRDRMTDTGIPLFDTDPEFASVDFSSENPPDTFKEQFEAALKAKSERLGREFKPAPAPNAMRTPGVVGGGASGNTLESVTRQVQALQRKVSKTPDEMKEYARLTNELVRLQKESQHT